MTPEEGFDALGLGEVLGVTSHLELPELELVGDEATLASRSQRGHELVRQRSEEVRYSTKTRTNERGCRGLP
ncbi:MAG: hypothetical protein IPK13_02230 [Deltaproteobacteria bacterium]|nr:hypothetical protein [Deltaproteobacteria bacterium]